jgi:hypothetical protein
MRKPKKMVLIGTAGVAGAVALLGAALVATGCLPKIETRTAPIENAESAPEFELKDATGQTHRLTELIADGPAVVVFYRGYW